MLAAVHVQCQWSLRWSTSTVRDTDDVHPSIRIPMRAIQDDDEEECPLCLDPLGDDIRFKPCNCGYRVRSYLSLGRMGWSTHDVVWSDSLSL